MAKVSKKQRQLSPLAQDRLAQLLTETGHALTLDDHSHIVRLDELARAVLDPCDDVVDSILNHPVLCGNVTLKKPSIGKLLWYDEYVVEWFSDRPDVAELVFAYLLASSNDEGSTDELVDLKTTEKIVFKWAKMLTATEAEFAEAMARVYPHAENEDGERGESSQEGALMALLAREYGHTPAWWLWEAPISLVNAMLADYVARNEAAERERRRAARGNGGGFSKGGSAKPVPPSPDRAMRAQKRLREYSNKLKQRWEHDGE